MKVCKVCGTSPAESIILQSASSRIIWWNHSKIDADLCAVCAERAYFTQQTRTLIQGWWGPLSALATIWFSFSNIARIDKHRKRIPLIDYEGTQILRPKLKARSNPGVIIASILAFSVHIHLLFQFGWPKMQKMMQGCNAQELLLLTESF
jgi:hypothetical protein